MMINKKNREKNQDFPFHHSDPETNFFFVSIFVFDFFFPFVSFCNLCLCLCFSNEKIAIFSLSLYKFTIRHLAKKKYDGGDEIMIDE